MPKFVKKKKVTLDTYKAHLWCECWQYSQWVACWGHDRWRRVTSGWVRWEPRCWRWWRSRPQARVWSAEWRSSPADRPPSTWCPQAGCCWLLNMSAELCPRLEPPSDQRWSLAKEQLENEYLHTLETLTTIIYLYMKGTQETKKKQQQTNNSTLILRKIQMRLYIWIKIKQWAQNNQEKIYTSKTMYSNMNRSKTFFSTWRGVEIKMSIETSCPCMKLEFQNLISSSSILELFF